MAVAQGVAELSVALAPERVVQLMAGLRPRLERALPQAIGVVGVDLKHRCAAADGKRRQDAYVRKFAADVHDRVAEGQLDDSPPPRPRASAMADEARAALRCAVRALRHGR
jgi:hypothetical protein